MLEVPPRRSGPPRGCIVLCTAPTPIARLRSTDRSLSEYAPAQTRPLAWLNEGRLSAEWSIPTGGSVTDSSGHAMLKVMLLPEVNYVNVWTFPITGPKVPDDAPANVVGACHAVGRDLQCRWHGPDTYMQNCLWTVSLLDTRHCHLTLEAGPRPRHKTAGSTTLKRFGFGGLHTEQPAQELTVLIGGEVQDQLAGGMPFVQWPIDGHRLLMPSCRDGRLCGWLETLIA